MGHWFQECIAQRVYELQAATAMSGAQFSVISLAALVLVQLNDCVRFP